MNCSDEGKIKSDKHALVFQTDFGLEERFVASMKGVALSVDSELELYDITHLIEPFNIWQASYTLAGTIEYWPKGTVFVSVVDPGVGTNRKSVVVKTKSGHFIVTPDNGALTLVAEKFGIAEIRQIDETVNRRPGSENSHTFHGRDVYAYTGARLAAGIISFESVGALQTEIISLPHQPAQKTNTSSIHGTIIHVEAPFGNIVTNIPLNLFNELEIDPEIKQNVSVEIHAQGDLIVEQSLPYVLSFGHVESGKAVVYSDSQQTIGLAINEGNFSKTFHVQAGADWRITFKKAAE